MPSLIGRSVPRREDLRLITGQGRYTDDLAPADAAVAFVLRSPHAHAAIRTVAVDEARRRPGVLAVLTGADYAADGMNPIPHQANAPGIDGTQPSFANAGDQFAIEHAQPVLATDRVRYVGEAVALVVAQTLEQAKDAAEAVAVGYDVLPAVVGMEGATAERAPQLLPTAPRNICLDARFGDEQATAQAFAVADLVIERSFANQRIVNCQMEPRAAFARFDPEQGIYTVVAGGQGVVRQRAGLCAALAVAPDKVRLISPDVGGGFGPRTSLYAETVLVAWAARRIGRPVRWNSDRSEAFLTDFQGRDMVTKAAAAFSAKGKLLALRMLTDGNLGAYPASYASLANAYRLVATVYDVQAAYSRLRGIVTNSTPTAPYRGAGRPEATFNIERLLDLAARSLNIDRVEIRRRNMIARSKLPYANPMGLTYDSGDFVDNMDTALAMADWKGLAARRRTSRKQGRLRGIGIANYVEAPVGALRERVVLTVTGDGVELVAGTQSTGQGHETVFAQVLSDRLGVAMDAVRLVTGDTAVVQVGGGSHSARSMRLVGTLLCEASEALLAQARVRAAARLGVAADAIAYAEAVFTAAGTNRAVSLFELAAEAPLSVTADISRRIPVHPTGCAVCEVEVDPDTGQVQITRYTSVDDVGCPINPLIVDGQVHGGIAQGIGQALTEGVAVDPASGQVVSASFMDYGLPRAHLVPNFDVALTEDPTTGNPLGVKGGGEGGVTPAGAAVINAIADALSHHGVEHVDMPATAARVWTAIQRARAS
jgi:carbon-monoxide dehydrogenase large subunit